jgi:hypothetical protein
MLGDGLLAPGCLLLLAILRSVRHKTLSNIVYYAVQHLLVAREVHVGESANLKTGSRWDGNRPRNIPFHGMRQSHKTDVAALYEAQKGLPPPTMVLTT